MVHTDTSYPFISHITNIIINIAMTPIPNNSNDNVYGQSYLWIINATSMNIIANITSNKFHSDSKAKIKL